MSEALRTDPKSFIIEGLSGLRNAIFPVVAVYFAMRGQEGLAFISAIAAGLAIIGIGAAAAYLRWTKFTYQINSDDIRVESGILARTARSVPFERIQDVSIEQTLLPRLFGLVTVKFETGSGGGEDISLAYLGEAEGERLRDVVRERRDADAEVAVHCVAAAGEDQPQGPARQEPGKLLFAMDPRRLFTFGVFEFSLAVFAVLAGLAQYADWFVDFEIWDPDLWRNVANEQSGWIAGLGYAGQVIGVIASLLTLIVVGSFTGLVRVFLRDWNFRLEETPRGFRRRRGLFTRTDVVMPAHRVQAVTVKTGWLRYRFGWRGLKFVSLAQDMGSANHDVAPFAQMEEIAPIIRAAGFEPSQKELEWQQTDPRYWIDQTLMESGLLLLLALGIATWGSIWIALIPLTIAVLVALSHWYGYAVHAHALDAEQVLVRTGYFSPDLQIASRVKLHSVQILQGPIAQRRGYANLHLGLAGGALSIAGLPIERARELRSAILASIAAKDFSKIYQAPPARLAA
ncbi:PH domain-containing protein [Altererythrobacter sp. GH1-8]|uniref:PH domain-containing protein n=1 Tax=Altererythrobacter sp. GH1-8 TaxID=3349333 RepID=UPI00374D8BC9